MAEQLGNGNPNDVVKVGVNGQSVAVASGTGAKYGIFGATPVIQQTPAANTTTSAAGSTTAVYVNTTFTGGSGSTAYTVGDLVAILKAHGLLKA